MFSKVVFINFGKFKSSDYASIFEDYLGRIKHYMKVEVREIKIDRDDPEYFNKIKDKIDKALEGTTVMAFSERGKLPTSKEFSNFIDQGSGVLSVVIGSSWGLPDYIEKNAKLLVSVGRLTLPHEAVRVLAGEQVYRACTIIRGESYHK